MISHDPITTEPINISDTKITKGTGNWVIFGTSQAWLHFDYLHSISLGTKCFFAIKSHQVPFLSKLHGSVENGKWKTNENERVDSKLRRLASTSRFPLQHESDPTIHLSISYFPSYPWTFQKSSVGSFAATAVMPTTLVDDKRNPKNIKQSKNRKKKKSYPTSVIQTSKWIHYIYSIKWFLYPVQCIDLPFFTYQSWYDQSQTRFDFCTCHRSCGASACTHGPEGNCRKQLKLNNIETHIEALGTPKNI